jgi:hypothetical protein
MLVFFLYKQFFNLLLYSDVEYWKSCIFPHSLFSPGDWHHYQQTKQSYPLPPQEFRQMENQNESHIVIFTRRRPGRIPRLDICPYQVPVSL